MQIVIATLPDEKFPLGRDVALAKSAALYGDETILYSHQYDMVKPYLDLPDQNPILQAFWVGVFLREGAVFGSTPGERLWFFNKFQRENKVFIPKAKRWLHLWNRKNLTRKQNQEFVAIEKEIRSKARAVCDVMCCNQKLVVRAEELKIGEDLGLINLGTLRNYLPLWFVVNQKTLISDISQALSRPEAYGAIDERLTPRCSAAMTRKQRITYLASEVFRRLPLFEKASFEEIKDIKQELAPYTTNFRRGLIKLSKQIRSQPWDKDFPHDVEVEIRSQLLPEVEAIDDRVKSNSYLTNLAYKVAEHPLLLPASSALGMALSTTLHASAIASQVASVIAGGGLIAHEAYKGWKKAKKSSEENLFFFYYRAGKMLARRERKSAARNLA